MRVLCLYFNVNVCLIVASLSSAVPIDARMCANLVGHCYSHDGSLFLFGHAEQEASRTSPMYVCMHIA